MEKKKYSAFISYSQKDKLEAEWIQERLEGFSLPKSLRKENPNLPKRIGSVFRDVTDLQIGVLSDRIMAALQDSEFLIILCSPDSACSEWVNQEIRSFLSSSEESMNSRIDKIIPIIISRPTGQTTRNGINRITSLVLDYRDCFPESLRSLSSREEILAANYYELGRDYALVKVAAKMIGIDPDTLWNRKRRHRKSVFIWICSVFFAFCAIVFYVYWSVRSSVQEVHSQRVIERAQALINSQDPITAERLLLFVIPDRLPKKRPAYLSKMLFLLREAEQAYQNKPRIIPDTEDRGFANLTFISEETVGSPLGIANIINGKLSHFPEEFHSDPRDFAFSENGTIAFFADFQTVFRYNILSGRLSVLFSKLWDKYITSISPTLDHRLGITFELSGSGYEDSLYEDIDTLACIIDCEEGTLLACMEHAVFDDKGEPFYFGNICINEKEHQAYLLCSDNNTLIYNTDNGERIGECEQPFSSIVQKRTKELGLDTLDVPFCAEWLADQGIVITSKTIDTLKKAYVQKGDSLLVLDQERNILLSAFYPYPIIGNCAELVTENEDPLGHRTILFSQKYEKDGFYSVNHYLLDWNEKSVVRINTLDDWADESVYWWSKEGNALVRILAGDPNSASITTAPILSSTSSSDDSICFDTDYYSDSYTDCSWPVSPDYATILIDKSIFSIDSGELIATIDSSSTSFMFCPDNLFVFKSEKGLTGIDTKDGSIQFQYSEYSSEQSDRSIMGISPNGRYLGFLHDGNYVVISLSDGHEVLRIRDGVSQLLTDETLYSYREFSITAWSLSTGKQRRFEACPISIKKAARAEYGYLDKTTPDQEYLLLNFESECCVFDTSNGKLAAVKHKTRSWSDFNTFLVDYPSDQLLRTLRERYRDNWITKEEIDLLLSE